ncbi:hypothetical protein MMC34_005804 [Xylographa carneopallida]|nr:hypothetical protein [Xylographa carneopallida]
MSTIEIDPAGDLVVRVIEYKEVFSVAPDPHPPLRQIAESKVCREVLMKSSKVFKTLLSSAHFMESSLTTITLEEDRVVSMEIWLRVLHNALIDNSYDVKIDKMWHLIKAADKYSLVIKNLDPWFGKWYCRQDVNMLPAEELLYPCFMFDHAHGFAAATRYLAYHVKGHIEEENPTKIIEFHLPHRVIRERTQAAVAFPMLPSSSLKSKSMPQRAVYEPSFTSTSSAPSTLSPMPAASAALRLSKATRERSRSWGFWPIEREAVKHSMHALLEKLRMFDWKPQESSCAQPCSRDYKRLVGKASKPRTGDIDLDYWRHGNIGEQEWFSGCRVPYRQPSWYYSFMGRSEKMNHFRKRNPLNRFREDDSE